MATCDHPRPKLNLPGYTPPRFAWQPPAYLPTDPAALTRALTEAFRGIYAVLQQLGQRRTVVPLIEDIEARAGQVIVGVGAGQTILLPEGVNGELGQVGIVLTDVSSPVTLVHPDGTTTELGAAGAYDFVSGIPDAYQTNPGGTTTAGDGLSGGGGTPLSVDVAAIAGAGLESDGSNNLRIAASAAGAGLVGGAGSALAVGAGDGIDVAADAVAVDVTDLAGTGLESDGSNNLRIAASAAGAGLTGGAGSALAVGAGTGISVAADSVSVSNIPLTALANQADDTFLANIAGSSAPPTAVALSTLAGDGIQGGANAVLNIDVSDFAGTGLEDDGSENLRIASSAAGAGLTGGSGSALAVGAGTGITVNANDVQLSTIAAESFFINGTAGAAVPTGIAGSTVAGAGLTYTTGGILAVGAGTGITVNANDVAWNGSTTFVPDGDKGDITTSASGATWTVDADINKTWTGVHSFTGTTFDTAASGDARIGGAAVGLYTGSFVGAHDVGGGDMVLNATGGVAIICDPFGTISPVTGIANGFVTVRALHDLSLYTVAGGIGISTDDTLTTSGIDGVVGNGVIHMRATDSFRVDTGGTERLEIENDGAWQLAGVTGTSGQALVSAGASAPPGWGAISLAALPSIADDTFLANIAGSTTTPTAVALTTLAGAGLTGGANAVLAVGAGTGITVNANDVAVTIPLTDGDKGDITVATSGTVWTVDTNINKTWTGAHAFNAGFTVAATADVLIGTTGFGVGINAGHANAGIDNADVVVNATDGVAIHAGATPKTGAVANRVTLTADDQVVLEPTNIIRLFTGGVERLEIEADGAWQLNSSTGTTGHTIVNAGSAAPPAWGQLPTAGIADAAVTLAKMDNLSQSTIIGRAAGAGTGVPTALTGAQVADIVGGTLIACTVYTSGATGTHTFNAATSRYQVLLIGGQGGGGGANSAASESAVGGEGGMGTEALYDVTTVPASVDYAVGAQGTAGANTGGNGGTGGDTQWGTGTPSTQISAGGGNGGIGSATATFGSGSGTTGGRLSMGGEGGRSPFTGGSLPAGATLLWSRHGSTGQIGITLSGTAGIGGGNNNSGNQSSKNGTGALSLNNTDRLGVAGVAGRIVVWEYS